MIKDRVIEHPVTSLRPGDHLCSIYEDESEYRILVTHFLAEGLRLGQKVFFACSEHAPEEVLAWLHEAGAPVDAAVAAGQFTILTSTEFYLPEGRFEPAGLLEEVSRAAHLAVGQGYPGLRAAGEMAWTLPSNPGHSLLLEYELGLSALCREMPISILCLYDRSLFDPDFLLDVLLAHPRVAVGAQVHDNFYYLPPEIQRDRSAARLDLWLDNLSARAQMHSQLEQTLRQLESLVDETSADLVKANAALRESERRYKTIFDFAGDAIFINDLDGRITEVNQIGCQRLGYSREELIGLTWQQIVPPANIEQTSGRLARLHERGFTSFETVHRTRDGRLMPVEINARRITYDGRPAVLSVVRDIAERKIAERALEDAYLALRESETKFRSLVEKSPVGIALTDENGMVIEWNESAQVIYGIPPEKVLGRYIWDVRLDTFPRQVRTPEYAAQLEQSIRDFLRTGEADFLYRPEERELIRPDGRVCYIQRIRFPIRTSRGFLLATIIADVTDHTLAEREVERYHQELEAMVSERTMALQQRTTELRESEERYRALVNQSPLSIMVIQDGCFAFVNPAGVAKLGYQEASELIGRPIAEIGAPGSMDLMAERLRRAEQGGENPPVVMQFMTPSGDIVFTESTSTPIFFQGRRAVLVIGQDISERILHEQQLEASLAEKEVMLREIHHRVKNNLNIIIALIDLQKANQTDPQVLQIFRELQMRAQSMSLVHESLYRSPSLAQVDFAGYLHTLVAYLYSAYGPGGSVESHYPIDLSVEAEGVGLRIETAIPCGLIVNELLTNALKYAFPPGRLRGPDRPQVRVRFERLASAPEGDTLVLTVSDNGSGLPPGTDWRAAQTLGLQLVQILSRQLGGTLTLDTSAGLSWRLEFKERG